MEDTLNLLRDTLHEMTGVKNNAYRERNQCIAALSKIYPSGLRRDESDDRTYVLKDCVYIDLPSGQASWHILPSELHLFAHLGEYAAPYDGHSTAEKYERLNNLPINQ